MEEGWTWLINSRKWHYFRDGRSICGKFMLLGNPELEPFGDKSPDNCAACQRKRLKELEVHGKRETREAS